MVRTDVATTRESPDSPFRCIPAFGDQAVAETADLAHIRRHRAIRMLVMRRDMFKVIVERPRRFGPGGWTRGRPPRDAEDGPSHAGMRRPYDSWHERKELNENLAPLRRYLMKQVGRPWNKVFSEICEHLRTDSTVQEHVRRHLGDFVAIHGRDSRPLYVDPRTGLLRSNKSRGRSGR